MFRRYPPSKGLKAQWCQDRDQEVRSWPDGVPGIPDWTKYEEGWSTSRLPDQPQEDDPEPFEISMKDLELSERQKVMLLPVDERIKMLVYPKSIQARALSQNKMRNKRKSRWAAKLQGHFL